jgi:acyl-CoA oxidase
MGQINRLVRLAAESNDKDFVFDVNRAVFYYSESFALRIGVHAALFKNVIQMLGSKQQQEEWVDNINEFRIIGCFAMVYILVLYFMQ